jgi:hypothetical protein
MFISQVRVKWLRLLTSNHLPLTAVGSNPDRDFGFFHNIAKFIFQSLVEALLRGSVVITQPTSAQNQTEVAIVEITDGHLRALADQTIVHAYAQNVKFL